MITKPTVLVLGAGASMPYKFPSGHELRELICQTIHGTEGWLGQVLVKHFPSISNLEIKHFGRIFMDSHINSIDSFLARRQEFAEIGKQTIATILCQKEHPDEFTTVGSNADHWYGAFWNRLVADIDNPDGLKTNNIKIITFNYDRSLEYFLHTAIKNTFRLTDSAALELLTHIPILHVYGQLGHFGTIPSDDTRPYERNLDSYSHTIAANGIKIIPEARDDDIAFQTAREYLQWAEHICFLGFSFDELNVKRLGIANIMNNKHVNNSPHSLLASGFGMTDAEMEIARRQLGMNSNPRWHTQQVKCLEMLRNYAWVLR
ncbi:MAG TPA: hypothetical protein VIE69_10015 [Methylophilaceae bacterium]